MAVLAAFDRLRSSPLPFAFSSELLASRRLCSLINKLGRRAAFASRRIHEADMPIQLVTIEGNIGSGKTTIARKIASFMPDTQCFLAPEPDSNPHWANFQSQPEKHALQSQLWFLRERLRVYIAALQHMQQHRESVILDFSIWSDHIFATSHYERGYMTAAEYAEYQAVSRRMLNELNLPPPHLSIVLHVKPEIALQRCETSETRSKYVKRESREEYAGPLATNRESYLSRLDELYRQVWLRDLPRVFTPKWLTAERVPPNAEGLPAAPALMILVRDWSQDLEKLNSKAICDAVMCTEPTDLDEWLAPWLAKGNQGHWDLLN